MSFLQRLSSLFKGTTATSQSLEKRDTAQKTQTSFQPRQIDKAKVTERDKHISKQQLLEAQAKAREIIIEAKDEAIKIRQQAEQELSKRRGEVDEQQKKLYQDLADVDRKLGQLEERERNVAKSQQQLETKFNDVEKVKTEQLEKLERVASLTRDEARKLILEGIEKKLKNEIGKLVKEYEDEAREKAEDSAKQILVDAMYHGATDYVAEFTVSVVHIDSEEIKGRVIGKEGRNIRSFEQATGVDVDLDEEGVIRLSCFDPVRREVARVSLETLIKDGRIQPARIEEVVVKTTKDIERIMSKVGEDLCHRVKVYNLPRQIVDTLGRFKYRYSHGQNMINHNIEVTQIGVALAQQVGANVNVVRLGCLLHDIGKVIVDQEGTHVELGVDLLKRNHIPAEVIDCVAEHHQDKDFSSIESVLVYIADAVSGARPGARYEDYEGFVRRMHELEEVAISFEGVKQAFAIQAGREVRVIVDPEQRDDTGTYKLAADIRDKIKKELTYPGAVRVTVIREIRKSEIAN
ncbi:ribonuclease Y [Candidatus Beckwithbacteria bacterium CG23_combo_of_CG06-09_8_20_14_all_34_8]|uniref:Ribonuclease Y n=1 Tax=Candidatus Beckwithbacteria bacterium CG23_combo_of_CG06-09_8_20_14_all_34_8 TaxID=1974497 RepID=A0A2H0B5V3_9BACT|nr:MAG: ribonuclease Y [Candidatus Beckwithbacteria bacterium CG23_combo_of_CG06-09_8_20_14_all_34_8]